jgi:hypothetical protein
VLEEFAAMRVVDVHPPPDDGRHVLLTRYTQPEDELRMLIEGLRLELPDQPPPKITAKGELSE